MGCTRVEPALLISINRSALTIWPQKPSGKLKSWKNTDKDVMVVSLCRWLSCKNSSIDCISTAQVGWNTKRLLKSKTPIKKFALLELKNEILMEKTEIPYLFWESRFEVQKETCQIEHSKKFSLHSQNLCIPKNWKWLILS